MVGVATPEELYAALGMVRTIALQRNTLHRGSLALLCPTRIQEVVSQNEGKDVEDSQRITGFSFFGRNLRFCLRGQGHRGVLTFGNLQPPLVQAFAVQAAKDTSLHQFSEMEELVSHLVDCSGEF